MAATRTLCGAGEGKSNRRRELGKQSRPARPTGMLQLRGVACRPWLTVSDRRGPMLGARLGHGWRVDRDSGPVDDGTRSGDRARPIQGDHCLVGKPPMAARQVVVFWTYDYL